MKTIVFRNARLQSSSLTDIAVENGFFIDFGTDLLLKYPNAEIYDLRGQLVVPPFVDSHIHLDYVYTASEPSSINHSGTLFEGIQCWSKTKQQRSINDIKIQAEKALKKELLFGTQYIRTHVDITDPSLTG